VAAENFTTEWTLEYKEKSAS